MGIIEITIGLAFAGLIAYALFAGADFGGGIWDLLAGGTEPGTPRRRLIEHAIGPIWEANHVWLIFVLVVLWTGFPTAFAAIMSTLILPLSLATVGIIGRGSAFAFRKEVIELDLRKTFGATFAASSLLTPFFLGTVAGGIASGRVPPGIAAGNLITSWVNPTSLFGGTLAVLTCAYLAAVYLTRDAEREGDPDLVAWFRWRALAVGVLIGAAALGGIVVVQVDAPELARGLTGRGLPFVLLSALSGIVSLWALWRRHFVIARVAAAAAVAAVLGGWAAAQYPDILPAQLSLSDAASSRATLAAMLASLAVGAVLVVPSLIALYVVFQRSEATGENRAAARRHTDVDGGEAEHTP